MRLDGPAVIANGTASIHRPIAGPHGFELAFPCMAFASGVHRFDVECFDPIHNRWAELKNSPLCTKDGKMEPCGERQ